MRDGIALLGELPKDGVDWILNSGTKEEVAKDKVIIKEGTYPDCVYFIMEGLVGISISAVSLNPIASRGPGEVLGELSFLEDVRASATVVALEPTVILAIPKDLLKQKLCENPYFGREFYRALAMIVYRRLKEQMSTVEAVGGLPEAGFSATSNWERLSKAIGEFKELVQSADAEALKHDGLVPSRFVREIETRFSDFCEFVNNEIGDKSLENSTLKQELGRRLQVEILPYILLTKTGERFYSKPRGYAGDYLTIEWIYENFPAGSGRIGPVLDRAILNCPGCKAVRNRRGLLSKKIMNILKLKENSNVNITSLASGPAREVFDVFETIEDSELLSVTLVDIDLQALAYVSEKRDKNRLKRHIKLIPGNLIYIAVGREDLKIKNQDLVYSIGLIDYFEDKFVVTLLNYIHKLLKPGGRVVLGNFHPNNPEKAFMEYVWDWKLIHRSNEQMNQLFLRSEFNMSCTNIEFEDEGINLFAECIKN